MAHALYITTFTKKDSIWAEFGFGQKFRSFFSSIFWATKEFWANVSVTLFTLNVWRQLFGSSYSDVFNIHVGKPVFEKGLDLREKQLSCSGLCWIVASTYPKTSTTTAFD